MDSILEKRVVMGKHDFTGTVPEIMRELVDICCIHPYGSNEKESKERVIPGMTLAPVEDWEKDFREIHYKNAGGTLLEALKELRGAGVDFAIGKDMQFWMRPMR